MNELLGTTPPVFIGVTLSLFGFAAFITGQALARTWRPWWHMVTYGALLGCGDRFIHYALFEGVLITLSGYLIGATVLIAIGLIAFRMTQAHQMVAQYPWVYERVGLFGWREKG